MKNLYAYKSNIEGRLDKLYESKTREDAAKMMEEHDIDPYTDGMGDMIVKLMAYVTDTPYEIWRKPLVDLTGREMMLFDNLEDMVDRFTKVETD